MSAHRLRIRSWLSRAAAPIGVAFALSTVCLPERAVRADEESDRKSYLESIESKLGDVGSYLSGFESDSDAGDLDRAMSAMREVENLVDKLDDVKGDDSRARDVASYYPRYISDWYEAAGYLRQLKDKQRLAPGYLTSCKAWDEAMRERAKNAKDEPNAADDLSTFAKSVGRQGEDAMNEGRRVRDQLDDAADEVDDFSVSTNNWSRVSSSTRDSGATIWRNWDRDFQEAVRACEEVVKRERHRAHRGGSWATRQQQRRAQGADGELRERAPWRTFLAAHPLWTVEFNEGTAKPRRAFGPPIEVPGVTAEEKATNFINTDLARFGVSADELVHQVTAPAKNLTYVHFDQSHAGIRSVVRPRHGQAGCSRTRHRFRLRCA